MTGAGMTTYEHKTIAVSWCDAHSMQENHHRAHPNLGGADGWHVVGVVPGSDHSDTVFMMERMVWDLVPLGPDDVRYVLAPPPSDAAPVAPRTERMELHDELDKRFPLFKDFAAFAKRGETQPERETGSCDRCGGGGYLTIESPRCPDCNPEDAPGG